MFKKKKITRGIISATLMFSSLFAFSSVISTNQALAIQSSAGGDGSGGSTGGSLNFYGWKAWFGDNEGEAYSAFKKWANVSDSEVKSRMNFSSGDLKICKNSYGVWAVRANYPWKTFTNWSGSSAANKKNTVSTVSGFTSSAKAAGMPKVLRDDTYDKWKNRDDTWLVCVTHAADDDDVITRTETQKVVVTSGSGATTSTKSSTSSTYTRNALYSKVVDVAPQVIGNPNSTRTIINSDGTNSTASPQLHSQTGDESKTNFANVYSQVAMAISSGNFISATDLQKLVDTAVAADSKADAKNRYNPVLSLDQDNVNGLADGGVMNVYNRERYASVSSTTTTTTTTVKAAEDTTYKTETQSRTCTTPVHHTWNVPKWKWNPFYATGPETCGPWKTVSTSTSVVKAGTVLSTSTETTGTNSVSDPLSMTWNSIGFWQIISVHCNQDGFNTLMNNVTGETIVNTGDPSKAISAVAYTKKYNGVPSTLDFGQPGTPSGSVDFYNKECPFECTASTTSSSSTVPSSNNGATSNVGDKNAKSSTNYGAISTDKINSNFFQFFRDNTSHDLTLDVWYPKTQNVVNYAGETPVTTTITRWSEGTPDISQGLASVIAKKDSSDPGVKLFNGSAVTEANVQKNWDTTTEDTSTTSILGGNYRILSVAGQWASETNKPEVFNVKWEYAPLVETVIPANNIGFNTDGTLNAGINESPSTQIQGKCYGQFGTKTGLDTTNLFQKYTGGGTTNTLDLGPINSPGSNPQSDHSNLVVKFVRATTE